jgi:hypothetical protein
MILLIVLYMTYIIFNFIELLYMIQRVVILFLIFVFSGILISNVFSVKEGLTKKQKAAKKKKAAAKKEKAAAKAEAKKEEEEAAEEAAAKKAAKAEAKKEEEEAAAEEEEDEFDYEEGEDGFNLFG